MVCSNIMDIERRLRTCESCYLCKNKRCLPKWTPKSKYAMLMEYPIDGQPEFMIPVWKIAKRHGFDVSEFLQISTVQCMPPKKKRQGVTGFTKPSKSHRLECRRWIEEYIKEVKPKKMIAFGNVPMEECIGEFDGITERHGQLVASRFGSFTIPTILSVHPKICEKDESKIDEIFLKLKGI